MRTASDNMHPHPRLHPHLVRQTVPARKGANARTIMAHAQAEAIPDGNGGIPQGIWCAWVWQFKADCCTSRVGVVRTTLCWSRRGGQCVLGQRYASPSSSLVSPLADGCFVLLRKR